MKHISLILASSSDMVAVLAAANVLKLGSTADAPLPEEICWMPAGEHQISAFNLDGSAVQARVVCDEAGAKLVAQAYAAILATGYRVFLDKDHKDEEATGWVLGFRWDPAQGIMAKVQWTALGEQLLRGKVYYSFSPAFLRNKKTGRVSGIPAGHAAGGLVNAPAFGAAMPALIAARLAGAEYVNPASGGSPVTNQNSTMNRDLIIAILAALSVQPPANATDEQLTALVAKHKDDITAAAAKNAELQAKVREFEQLQAKQAANNDETIRARLAEFEILKAKDAARRKADAKAAVDAAVARGALPAKDETIQAKWLGLIETDPANAELLKAMQANPALTRLTTPGAGLVIAADGLVECLRALHASKDSLQRGHIFSRDVSPLFAKNSEFGRELALVLAANSLGTLSGELITQRSLSLLKLAFPWLAKVSTDFSANAIAFGQTVKTRLRTIPGVVSFVPGTGYVRQDVATTDVDVVIDQHKGVEIAFNANEMSSTTRDLFGEQVEGCHYALGKAFVDALLGLITVDNFDNETVEATASVDADTMDAIDAELAGRGVVGPRIGLLTSPVFRKLGKDSSIVNLATFQMREIITQAMLPPIKNIQPYEVFNMPAPAGENLTGFAGTSDALAFATRLPNDYTRMMPDVPSNGVVQTVTNPDTGISVMLVRYIDHKLAEAAWRIAVQFGTAVGNPDSGQRLISAARS